MTKTSIKEKEKEKEKEQKQYTSIKSYKPTGNLVYDEEMLVKIEKEVTFSSCLRVRLFVFFLDFLLDFLFVIVCNYVLPEVECM